MPINLSSNLHLQKSLLYKISKTKKLLLVKLTSENVINNNPSLDIINLQFLKRHYSKYIQHKYDKSLEKLINTQIKDEFHAGYTYLNIANHFARSDVALPGLHGFFMKMFYEELEHALDFIKYQTLRGGQVDLCPISCETPSKWDVITVFACGLDMEKNITEKICSIHVRAAEKGDTDVQNFLDGYINHQEKSIQEMARYYTRAKLLGKESLAVYLFDRELHQTHVRKLPPTVKAEIGSEYYT